MGLIEYYKKVIESLNLIVDDDGFIYVKLSNGKMLLLADGKPMVLPTKENIASIVSTIDDEVVITKSLFNPIAENVVKGDSVAIKKTKYVIEKILSHQLAACGELLLTLASKKNLVTDKLSFDTNKFLAAIVKADNPGIKKLVDETSIENWLGIYSKMLKNDRDYISIFLKKSGTHDGIKYNRLATTSINIYPMLTIATPDNPVEGVKLRRKDITIFKLMIEHIFGEDMTADGCIYIGSKDDEHPAYICMMETYIKLCTKMNSILEELKYIDESVADEGLVKLTITLDELSELKEFKGELMLIPTDLDINRMKDMPIAATTVTSGLPTDRALGVSPVLEQQPKQETYDDDDPIDRMMKKGILGGRPMQYNPYAPQIQPLQQPMYPMPAPMAQQAMPMAPMPPPAPGMYRNDAPFAGGVGYREYPAGNLVTGFQNSGLAPMPAPMPGGYPEAQPGANLGNIYGNNLDIAFPEPRRLW